jgi:hypothetical protein
MTSWEDTSWKDRLKEFGHFYHGQVAVRFRALAKNAAEELVIPAGTAFQEFRNRRLAFGPDFATQQHPAMLLAHF